MQLSQILPCKFSSNIYVQRELLSEYLTNMSAMRYHIGTLVYSPDDIQILDNHLKKAHYKFIDIKKTITTLEKDVFNFEG